MKRALSTLTLVFFLIPLLYAQSDEAVIKGEIYDQEGNSIPQASVAIYDSTESEVVTGAASDSNGTFNINVNPGSYVLKITYISYRAYTEPFQISSGETVNVGEITLNPSSENLDEIYVRGERSQMEMSFDRRVFNVGQDITSMGGTAVNVLDNVPSISTDIEGNISLRGNESVRVLINGKPSSMVSGDVDALRSIPANMIEEVEIITNPSSKYAAEGSAGIINIVLRKERERGFNGSISAGTGYPEEYEGSVNLNYRVNNINWFADIGVDYRSDPESGNAFERYSGPDADNPETTYMYRENTDSHESEIDGDFRFGADFYLSESEVLTASTFINLEKGTDDEDILITDYEYESNALAGDVVARSNRENIEEERERDFDINLDYENQFDGDDHKLVADASFDISRENAETDIQEQIIEGSADPIQQRSNDTEEEMDLRFNAEYVRPLGENGKLEAGLRSDTEWMDTGYRAETLVNGNWVGEEAFNDNFLYLESVHAAYAIVGTEFGDFSGQIGVRAENTRIRTEIKSTGDVSDQNYLNLFPTVFLNYSFNDRQSVQVSYSRRLRRPWSRMLLPIVDIEDPRSQFTGNPNLTPEFSNSFEAGYLHYWESGSLLTSFYYRHRTDVIERITESQGGGNNGTIRRPINLSTEEAWGIEFSADQELANSLTLTGNANLYRSNSNGSYQPEGSLQEQIFSSESDNFQARMRLRWDIGDAWYYQASMRYRGPRQTTQGRRNGNTMMDTGLAYDLMDGRAKVSLNVRDVLDSRNFDNTVTTDGNPDSDFYSHREFSWSSRSFSLNFQYFFGANQDRGGRGGGDYGGDDW